MKTNANVRVSRVWMMVRAALAAIWVAGHVGTAAADAVPTNQVNMVPPGLVNYQGTLLTPTNSPYINGIYDIDFRLYPGAGGGTNTALWGAGYKVYVNGGVFGVMLGASGGTTLGGTYGPTELWKALWFDETNPTNNNRDLYLGITVRQDQNHNGITSPAEAVPRQQFLVTPYAARAQQAEYARRASGNFDVAGGLTAPSIACAFSNNSCGGYQLVNSGKTSGYNQYALLNMTGVYGNRFAIWGYPSGGTMFSLYDNGNVELGVNAANPVVAVGYPNKYVPVAEENLRIVRGRIGDYGSIVSGSGFTSQETGTGVYLITLNSAFAGIPAVTATAEAATDGVIAVAVVYSVSAGSFRVSMHAGNSANAGWIHNAFDFIAVGPR